MTQQAGVRVLLSHGDGGALTRRLVRQVFLNQFSGPETGPDTDAAVFETGAGRAALTTDSFVISPLFFPGGDIGKLAVCGTVNDLAVSGARPLFLTAAFIIEEGFAVADLARIAASMARTAREAAVRIIAGDTKVVGRGQADGVYINTTGYGSIPSGVELGYHRVAPGDRVLVSGTVGEHGLAVLVEREQLGLEGQFGSDCAPLHGITGSLLRDCRGVKWMRDLTRGGLATAAAELAEGAGAGVLLEEAAIPVRESVRGGSEMLGLDPLYLANEGKFMAVVEGKLAESALQRLKKHPLGHDAAIIGRIRDGEKGAFLETALGGTRYLELFEGAPLPRIC